MKDGSIGVLSSVLVVRTSARTLVMGHRPIRGPYSHDSDGASVGEAAARVNSSPVATARPTVRRSI